MCAFPSFAYYLCEKKENPPHPSPLFRTKKALSRARVIVIITTTLN
jgi:hypothetical protein